MIKLTAYSPVDFVSNSWNLFDSVIVVVSLVDLFVSELLPGLTILRAFRLVSRLWYNFICLLLSFLIIV